jgi:hypothetical protein
VQLDQTAHQSKSDAKTFLERIGRALTLRKEIENPQSHIFGESDTGIRYPENDFISFLHYGQRYPSTFRSVLRGVVQQVSHHLSDAARISSYPQCLRRN